MKNKLIAIALFAMSACNSPSKWQNGEVVVEESPKILNGYGKKIVNYQDSISAIFLSGSNGVLSKKMSLHWVTSIFMSQTKRIKSQLFLPKQKMVKYFK